MTDQATLDRIEQERRTIRLCAAVRNVSLCVFLALLFLMILAPTEAAYVLSFFSIAGAVGAQLISDARKKVLAAAEKESFTDSHLRDAIQQAFATLPEVKSATPIWICSSPDGGCGFIGHFSEFSVDHNIDSIDAVYCPNCLEDHCFQLTEGNITEVTDNQNRGLAEQLLKHDENIVGMAQCGCVHHAEDGQACIHDVALVRERYYTGKNEVQATKESV